MTFTAAPKISRRMEPRMRPGDALTPRHQRGYGFVAILLLLAVVSLGLSSVSSSWSTEARRDKEQQLIRIGQLYVQALERYRRVSPGTDKRLPMELDELLLDQRFVGTVRHLRRLYPDPVSMGQAWGVIRSDDGRIQGVYSLSQEEPLIKGTVARPGLRLAAAARYSDWKFVVDSDK
jgi:type II secretory pathway pseudopilin PulG